MARLGVFYQIDDEELEILKKQKQMYDYLLDEIEEKYLGTDRAFEIDKAWYEIQFCLGEGEWSEENSVPHNIIFGGDLLLDTEEEVISLKTPKDIANIVAYLRDNSLKQIIERNFDKIREEDLSLSNDENSIEYLVGWSEGLAAFYALAQERQANVIFSVDL